MTALAYVISSQWRFTLSLGLFTAFTSCQSRKAFTVFYQHLAIFRPEPHRPAGTLGWSIQSIPFPKFTKRPPCKPPKLKASLPLSRYSIFLSDHDRLNSQGRRMEVPRLSRLQNPSHLLLSALQQYARLGSTAFYVDHLIIPDHHFHCYHHQQTARRQTHQLYFGSHARHSQLLFHHLVPCPDRACGGVPAFMLFKASKSTL